MPRHVPIILLLLVSLTTVPAALAAATFDLPADVQKLLPNEPAAIVVVSSVNELADQYVAVLAAFDEGGDSRAELVASFGQLVPGFLDFVDLDKPFVFVAGLPNPMAGGEPPFTYIVPMNPGFAGRDTLMANSDFVGHASEGDYQAFSSDPLYAPGTELPALTEHLSAGIVSASLDLRMVVENFGPFLEMGLAGIPTRSDMNPEGLTTEEAQAMATTLREVMASVSRLDLALGRDGNLITWHTGLGVIPGTALDAGPQPNFARAVDLTGALPADVDFLQVIALDQTRIFATFRDYYLIMLTGAVSGMEPEQAARYSAWVENYLTSMDLWASPMAAALRMDQAGMAAHAIMEPTDAEAALDKLTEIINGMTELGIGYTLTQRKDEEISGVKFRAWDIDFDLAQFEAVMPNESSPSMSGTDRMQAEQMVSILRKIMPVVYLGTKDGRLFMASDADTDALARMVKAADKKGKPVVAVTDAAAKAGPACQQVITGDMLALINWVTELMEEVDNEQRILIDGNPIPFEAMFTIENPDLGFNVGMDLQAMGNLIKAVAELDALGAGASTGP